MIKAREGWREWEKAMKYGHECSPSTEEAESGDSLEPRRVQDQSCQLSETLSLGGTGRGRRREEGKKDKIILQWLITALWINCIFTYL